MKRTQRITRIPLIVSDEGKRILFGIVSADPDYKLSLAINRKLSISLRNVSPVSITHENTDETPFSRFSDAAASPDLIYSLVSNRSEKSYLIRKLKNIDFLFLVQSQGDIPENERIAASLREIETITAVFNLELNTVPGKYLEQIIH